MHRIEAIDMKVVEVKHYSPSLFLLCLQPTSSIQYLPACKAGQFVQVHIPSVDHILLRRPFSIYDVSQDSLQLLIQNVGSGTQVLSQSKIGDIYNVLLPLGNGFDLPDINFAESMSSRPLLIGGGVGIAPLYYLARQLQNLGIAPTFLFGAKGAEALPDMTPFQSLGDVHLATEDGSLGETGFVTQHSLIKSLGDFDLIYTCGPTPMMKAVALLANEQQLPCQVSLENHMACGVGVCLCCTEPSVHGYKTVCTDGPVFNSEELLWN